MRHLRVSACHLSESATTGAMKLSDSVAVRLGLAQGASGLIGGMYTPFFSAWLGWRGLSAPEIGVLLSLGGVLRVVTGPVTGLVADARNDRRTAMIVLFSLQFAGYAALNFVTMPLLIFVAAIIANVAGSGVAPLLESVCLRFAERYGFRYGHVRAWGPAGFIAANVLSGAAVSLFGLVVVAPWLTIVLAMNVTAIWLLPAPPKDRERHEFRASLSKTWSQTRELIRSPTFAVFLLGASLAQASHAFYYGFGSLHWLSLGFPGWLIGILWPLGIVIEVALFAFSHRVFAALGATRLLILGCAASILRWTIMAFDPPLPLVIFAQLLHGGTFALSYLGAMFFIQQAVPPRLAATAQSLYAVASSGLAMGLAIAASGAVYEQLGGRAYLLMTALAVIAIGFAFLLRRMWHGGRLTTHPEEEDHGFV
jgi:PPP family 3-phenylpropionic acid transporter